MHLIVGLGNPGEKYKDNRHNIGFAAIDEIAHFYSASNFNNKFAALFATCEVAGHKVALLKPQTYMNLSGRSVIECSNFYKIPTSNITVIHDELDLECGRVKVKVGGGNAGHNGLKSIDNAIGTHYNRVRVGISRPEHATQVPDYVLSDFINSEVAPVMCAIKSIAKNADLLIAGDFAKFMNNCALEQKQLENE
jgi:PTH1 family peptidyl-tRNA hydrolase